jgi:uncharacterized membrane protein YsdA (DUF1294 family)
VGTVKKITHAPGSEFYLWTTIISSLVFLILAGREIFSSKKIDIPEKVLWGIGLLCFGVMTGIIYMLFGRKKVVDDAVS